MTLKDTFMFLIGVAGIVNIIMGSTYAWLHIAGVVR